MKKSYIVFFIITFSSIFHPLSGETPEFRKIIEDYLSVKTIKASITQHIYLEDGSTEFYTGNYFAASKGFIRIDYIKPESQTVVVNDGGLFWYYNDRKLLFVSGKDVDNRGPIPAVMNVIPAGYLNDINVVSQGMRLYSFFKTAEIYTITTKKEKTKIVLYVDPVLNIIKRKIMLDESGREIMKEDYIDHVRIDGVYIPSAIELKARTSTGIVHTLTEYSNMIINSPADKDLFKFKITPDMKVRTLNER